MKRILFLFIGLMMAQSVCAAMYTFKNNTRSNVAITIKNNGGNQFIFTMPANSNELSSTEVPFAVHAIEANILNKGNARTDCAQGFKGGTWTIAEQDGQFTIEKN